MSVGKILKILFDQNLVIDYLGYNETDTIIRNILGNDALVKQLQDAPVSFWENALKNGILVYSEYTYITKNDAEESLDFKYQQFCGSDKMIPALVYQKRRLKFKQKKLFYGKY